jgi:hypothetical protein
MRQVAYNIGYIGYGNSGVLNSYPFVWDCDFPTFAKKIRQKGNTKSLFKWAKSNHIPPSLLTLNITIWYESEYWNFTIKMINVREYRALWEGVYKKEWKDAKKDNL